MPGSSQGDQLTWEADACEEGIVRAPLDASSLHPGPTCLVPQRASSRMEAGTSGVLSISVEDLE